MSVALDVSSTVDVRCLNFSMQLCFWTWGLLMLGDVSLKTGPFWDLTTETNVLTFLKNRKLFARTIYIRLLIKIYHKSFIWTKKWKKWIFQFMPLNALYISVSWVSILITIIAMQYTTPLTCYFVVIKNILCNSSINYPYLEPMIHVYMFMIEEVISGH